jgi:hypothetical protein
VEMAEFRPGKRRTVQAVLRACGSINKHQQEGEHKLGLADGGELEAGRSIEASQFSLPLPVSP